MCIGVLSSCVSVYHVCTWCPWKPEGSIESPRTGITAGCESHVGARRAA